MISLEGVVWTILYLLIAVVVLGLLWWLIGYFEREFGGPPMAYKVIRAVFVILIVLLLIGLLLSLLTGRPLFR